MTFAVAGQPSPLNSARVVNRVLNASDFYNNTMALGGAVKSKKSGVDADFVEIKNVSGDNLPRGSVVQLGDFLLDDKVQQHLRFESDLPDDTPDRKIVILLGPVPNDGIGTAVGSGICIARVNVSDEIHGFANAVEDSAMLESSSYGSFELLTIADGTGEQEMVVRFVGGIIRMVVGKTDSGITKGSGGGVSVYDNDDADTGENIYAENKFANLTSGKWVIAALIGTKWYLLAGECI